MGIISFLFGKNSLRKEKKWKKRAEKEKISLGPVYKNFEGDNRNAFRVK